MSGTGTPATEDPALVRDRGRLGVVDLLRWGLLVLILLAVAYALWRNWGEVSGELSAVSGVALLEAFLLALTSPLVTMLGWRVLLADLGSRLHPAQAASVFFVGQLGKYLPGSVWTVVAQTDMAARLEVPRRRTAMVGIVALVMSVLTGAFVGIPAIPLALDRLHVDVPAWLVIAAAVIALGVMSPPVLNRCIDLLFRVTKRPPLEHRLSAVAVILAFAWFVAAWVTMGLSVLVLADDLGAPTGSLWHILVVTVCGYALSGVLGMLGFVVPAGVGIRDGVTAALLATIMPLPAAAAVALLSRFLTVVTDVLVAGFGWSWGRRHRLIGAEPPG